MNKIGVSVSAFVFLAWSAQLSAATIYNATLSGATEVPPTGSTATGSATLTLSGDSLTVVESFSGLIGRPGICRPHPLLHPARRKCAGGNSLH